MCGRYTCSADSTAEFVRETLDELERRHIAVKTGVINPGDIAAVIASNRRLEPQAFAMKWGYRLSGGKLVFNARSETAEDKPLFADGMKQRRCLIPADSYFEWQKLDHGKQKYVICPEETDGFFLAGIYRLEQGNPEFSVLTREPAEAISFIHDRMPVILPRGVVRDWLDPGCSAKEFLPYAVQNMKFAPARV